VISHRVTKFEFIQQATALLRILLLINANSSSPMPTHHIVSQQPKQSLLNIETSSQRQRMIHPSIATTA
jgi:hypothetical protein